MPQPRKPISERQSEGIYVRFTPAEYRKVKWLVRSKMNDKPVGTYVRELVLEDITFHEQEKV